MSLIVITQPYFYTVPRRIQPIYSREVAIFKNNRGIFASSHFMRRTFIFLSLSLSFLSRIYNYCVFSLSLSLRIGPFHMIVHKQVATRELRSLS